MEHPDEPSTALVSTKRRPSRRISFQTDLTEAKPSNAIAQRAPSGKLVSAKNSAALSKAMANLQPGDSIVTPIGTLRRIQPAKSRDVISVARAMHQGKFAERVQALFAPERDAALTAIKSGCYISWRCPDQQHDCQRIGPEGMCFCGHQVFQHKPWDGYMMSVPCQQAGCRCRGFSWVPSRPEEVGEFWLRKRPDFDPATWRAKCKCKHAHDHHDPSHGDRRCQYSGCSCRRFASAFLCAACDRHWELHETFFESADMRLKESRAVGQDYLPFAEAPGLHNIVMGGVDSGFDTLDEAIGGLKIQQPQQQRIAGPYDRPMIEGPSARRGNDAAFASSAAHDRLMIEGPSARRGNDAAFAPGGRR